MTAKELHAQIKAYERQEFMKYVNYAKEEVVAARAYRKEGDRKNTFAALEIARQYRRRATWVNPLRNKVI